MGSTHGKFKVDRMVERKVARDLFFEGIGITSLYAAPGEVNVPPYLTLYGGHGLKARGKVYDERTLAGATQLDRKAFRMTQPLDLVDMSIHQKGSENDKRHELERFGIEIPADASIAWMNAQLLGLFQKQRDDARAAEAERKRAAQLKAREAAVKRQQYLDQRSRAIPAVPASLVPDPAEVPAISADLETAPAVATPSEESVAAPAAPAPVRNVAAHVLELAKHKHEELVELAAMALPDVDVDELDALRKNELIYRLIEAAEEV